MSKQAAYTLEAAIEHMQRITRMQTGREWRITIRKQNPGGLTAHQTVEVASIYAGFDWQAGQVIIEPAAPLVQLTTDELEQFRKSAAEGQSWHTYKITENYRKKAQDAIQYQKDALRYRWLRDSSNWSEDGIVVCKSGGEDTCYGEDLDSALDAAMAQAGSGEQKP